MPRRRTPVFGLAFLDAMTCGFGAVVLLYMVINAAVDDRVDQATGEARADAHKLEEQVLDGYADLVELRNTLQRIEAERADAQGLSKRLIEELEEIQKELATFDQATLAQREHLNRLQADLRSLEEAAKRLAASIPDDEVPGDRVRAFVGDGDRQYLTGLKVGGDRIFVLVDSSSSMLADTLVNVLVRRNLPAEERRRAGKWRRAVATVDWLTTQLPADSQFQVYRFAEEAEPLLEGTGGKWLDAGDRRALDRTVAALRQTPPEGGTNLHRAIAAARAMRPAPDNLILITDGLPTQGRKANRRGKVSGKQRLRLFREASAQVPRSMPVNVVLFPMEGDPKAPSAFWKLALDTGGSFMSPSEDWP
ncbi:MAG: VWA domain-containing protein [Acidobacteriota bacterium]